MKFDITTRSILLAFAMACSSFTAFSQTDSTDTAADERARTFTVGANYGTNTTFYGRSTGYKRPYASTDFTYSSKKGFWISTALFEVMNTPYFVDGTDVSTGWTFDLTKKIDGSVSYSRYFFSSESPMLQAVTSNLAAAHVGLDWYYLYSSLAASTIFGGANDYFLTFSNSRYFEHSKVFSKKGKDYISIDPRVSIIAGTQNFANSYISSQANETYKNPVAPAKPAPVGGKPGGNNNGGSTTQPTENTSASQFNILNYELRVPVTYTYGNFSLETTWSYVKPVNLLANDNSQPQSIFTVSAFYIFKFKK